MEKEVISNRKTAPWTCPVCGCTLYQSEKTFSCSNRHSFDIAKSGYVNLLLSSGKGNHGDDRLMVRARTVFLNKGYYRPLADRVSQLVSEYSDEDSLIIDAGCGEGYYTKIIADNLHSTVAGIDISKEAVMAASKQGKDIYYATASSAEMPLKDDCTSVIVNIFAPLFEKEFSRVLSTGGKLIRVVPGEKHLWELKELVYDRPYENPAPQIDIQGFSVEKSERLEYTVCLEDNASIRQLFMMTPYYYKTGETDQNKLSSVESLNVLLSFEITVYTPLTPDVLTF
jgi:Methylase involved in ubiquinone/menaquinone biosynthesis